MKQKKAQVGIEFLMVFGALLFFVAMFFLAIQIDTREENYHRENIILKEIALTARNEINLASESKDGYYREFNLSKKAGNLEYEIMVDTEIIYIKTTNNRHALTVPVKNVTGNLNIPNNTIKKINNIVYLNQ